MNTDHKESVISFARHYAGCSNPTKVKMLSISPKIVELEVDGNVLQISFDHNLTDSEDVHRTLVRMLKAIPKSVP